MNRKRLSLLLAILLLALSFIGCDVNNNSNAVQDEKQSSDIHASESYKGHPTLITSDFNNVDIDKLNDYTIYVEFNPSTKSYTASQKVEYVNNEDVELNELYFHLYPNAFREKETAPFLFDNFEEAFPDGFKPGGIDIKKLSIDDKSVENYSIEGHGKTILKLPLEKVLKPGENLVIDMEYGVVLPPAQDRFGYGEKTFNFGNWYPIAAVYDDEGWNLDPYYSIGDPFYSDTSNYDITITVPKNVEIASSGNILSEKIEGNNKIWKIEAKLMRDFAWVASEHFIKKEKEVDGTIVKVYFLEEDEKINKFAEEASYNSIEIFNDKFGQYPYGQYSVVATSFPSGMEYPGIVFIGEKYYDDFYKGYLEIVIAHETGHQWWYGVVGNDEIDEAWLDESLTTYSEVVYAQGKYGDKVAENYYANNVEEYYKSSKEVLSQSSEVVVKPLSEFENWDDYGPLVYNKGAMLLNEIKVRYGDKTLYTILNNYFNQYKFKNATTEDFIKVCEEVTGDNFDQLANEWLYGK